MGKGKYTGIFIVVLVAFLASPSLYAAQGPVRINESFVLGDSGCQMNLELEGDAVISANLGPAFVPPAATATTYSFDFTGTVDSVTGLPNWGVGVGSSFSGTLTYAPSTFSLGATTSDSQLYQGNESTIASITINFDLVESGSQSFKTSAFGYSSVINNRDGSDMYDFYSASLSSVPQQSGEIRSVFFLRDDNGTAFTGLDYPTNLVLNDWEYRTLAIYIPGPAQSIWQVDGNLTSLVPSPPEGIIILNSAAVQQSAADCEGSLPIEQLISDTLVCEDCTDNGDGTFTCSPEKCQPKTYVERNILEKSGDGSRYCYYTTTGQQVCKTF
jgi:hypothetical protein